MNMADYVVSYLAAHGVRQIFGYPGAAILPLMEAIDRHPDVQWILVRNEGAASLAASASARITQRLAVCLSTSGPGATNMVTGLIDAQVDRAPVLALTGLVPTWKQSRAGFQDLDQARLLSTVLPLSMSCNHPDQLPGLLRDCIGYAEQNRDVTHLALPIDVQATEIAEDDKRFEIGEISTPLTLQSPPKAAFEIVAKQLDELQQVVIAVGPRAYGAGPEIEALADILKAPILSSLDAKGIIDETHPCSLGVLGIFGAAGVELTQKILADADAVVAFGMDNVANFLADLSGVQIRKLIEFDADFSSITHRFHRTRTLVGPLKTIAEQLARQVAPRSSSELLGRATNLKQEFLDRFASEMDYTDNINDNKNFIHPAKIFQHLNKMLGEGDVIAFDIGDSTVWAAQYLQLTARQRVLVSNQLGAMGFCLSALIASKLAYPERRAIGFSGDGGLQMVLAELLTAVQYQLPIVIFLFNNGVLQRVAAQQTKLVGTRLHNPDFVALAQACGAAGAVVNDETDIDKVLHEAFSQTDKPFLIDCHIGPNVKAPMSGWNDDFTPMHFSRDYTT